MQAKNQDNKSIYLQEFSLNKTRLIVNKQHPSHSLVIEGLMFEGSNQPTNPPNLLVISLQMTINQSLNQCLHPKARVLELWLSSLKIEIELVTRQGQFCFQEMNYYMFLEVRSNKTDNIGLRIDKVSYQFKRTCIQMEITLHREGSTLDQVQIAKQLILTMGNNNTKEMIRSQIASFKVESIHMNRIPQPQEHIANKFKFIDGQYSLPLKAFSHHTQIYNSLGIRQNCTTVEIQALIQSLPPYSAQPLPHQQQLYFCHDMKGGYKEDLFVDHNIVPTDNIQNINYRAFHLEQCQIFNYFSHHNISIPPKMWRILCKRYGTQCLATFITERQDYSESMLTSRQFALFLVAIARKCHFDGYLINIQRNIRSVTALKQWLEFLTIKIHQFIPNSTIIWYDSIRSRDGVVHYQNALTHQNYDFYNNSDGLFTNYWWDQSLLKHSVELKGQNKKRVYIGNDCFGRNTYGGGKTDIFKAANKILQYKNKLGIALFAPAYTYETGGENNRQFFKMQENGLYNGIKMVFNKLQDWKQSKKKQESGGWERQDQWTVSSFGRCQKSIKIGFPPLSQGEAVKVVFFCQVASTPPVFNSPYKIILQLVDTGNTVIAETDVYNFNNYKKTTERVEAACQQIDVHFNELGNRQTFVRVIIMAQSKQKWAGYFGPRFKSQMVSILSYEKERHWTSKIPINQVVIGSPYHSYCNTGVGDFFFHEGLPMQSHYNYLADMDIPHTHIINHPFDTQIDFQRSFQGASSLNIKRPSIKLLKVLIPSTIDLSLQYFLVITVFGSQGITPSFKYVSKNEEDRVFSAKLIDVEDINEWKRFTYKLITTLKQITVNIRSIIELTSIKSPYSVGEIKIINGKKVSESIKCTLQNSKDMVPAEFYYLNLTIESKMYKRLLVVIKNLVLFAYFDSGIATLINIPLQKCESFEIQIIDSDESLDLNTLRQITVNSFMVGQLLLKGSVTF